MESVRLLFIISVFIFPFIQSSDLNFGELVSSNSNVLKYYENLAEDLVSHRLDGIILKEYI